MGNCRLGPGQLFPGTPSIWDFPRTHEPMDHDPICLQGAVQGVQLACVHLDPLPCYSVSELDLYSPCSVSAMFGDVLDFKK